jgi:hypothetical protein
MIPPMKKQLHFTPQASDSLTEQSDAEIRKALKIRKGVE